MWNEDDEETGRGRTGAAPRKARKVVAIERTRVGRGVFATRNHPRGGVIGEIKGKVIEDESYSSDYCFDLGDAGCLEPDPPFRFMNHSCRPNCRFDYFDVLEPGQTLARRRVFVFARWDIMPGDELTIDYRWPVTMAIRCRCGSEDCRGWIVAAEQLDELLRQRGAEQAA